MSISDIADLGSLLQKGGPTFILAVAVLALAWVAWKLLSLLLGAKDAAIAHRDGELAKRDSQLGRQQDQIDRQQDLFDQALDLLGQPPRRGGGGTA